MQNIKKERRKIIIDFEVLTEAKFWLCHMKDVKSGKTFSIINDEKELRRVYEKNKDSIWIGYNIKGYDQWIFKTILANECPFNMSKSIMEKRLNPWDIYPKVNKIPFTFFEIGSRDKSLKELELFMGESIEESSIPFDLNRYPTKEEINELLEYCKHDVEMTYKVFLELIEEYESQEFLIDFFNLDDSCFKKTKAQLSALILGAKKPEFPRNDEFLFKIVDTIKLDKYKFIMDWYNTPSNRDYNKSLTTKVYGSTVDFGWGGLHSAKKQYKGEGFYVNSDVASFYPSLMIRYNLLSRNVSNPDKFTEIRDTRLEFKSKKDKREKPFKIVLNGTFGASKDANNELYDPQMANAICVNGQIMLLDLIEKVENHFGDAAEFIQGNTDGVLFKFNSKKAIEEYIEICNEWSKRTGMVLEHDNISKIVQKDVNNYAIVMENGKVKSKGAYVKKLSHLDNDLPIINKAILNNILYGVDIRKTIEEATDLIDFQKSIKISSKYENASHNGNKLNLKVLRVFASIDYKDGPITKSKGNGQEKIGNTPNRAFIMNERIIGKKVPKNLDKEWYISLAEKRLEDFIPNSQYEYSLLDLLG